MTPINKTLGYLINLISFGSDGSLNTTLLIGYEEPYVASQMPPTNTIISPDGTTQFRILSSQTHFLNKSEADSVMHNSGSSTKTVRELIDEGIAAVLVSKGALPA